MGAIAKARKFVKNTKTADNQFYTAKRGKAAEIRRVLMIKNRVDELVKSGMDIIGPRIKDGHCVFCGGEVEKGSDCSCKDAVKIKPQVVKMRNLIEEYGYIKDLDEFTQSLIASAHFPKKFSGMDFEDYLTETEEQKTNLKTAKDYAENGLKNYLQAVNLIFVGSFGNGKTMLMCIMGADIIKRYGIGVKYVNIYDLSEELKKTFENKNLSTSKIIEAYKKAQILILDDIDKVQPSPWICDLMYGFANYRSDNLLPTWLSANHSLEELSDKFYGESTISRFYDNSIKAKFTGKNWRLKG